MTMNKTLKYWTKVIVLGAVLAGMFWAAKGPPRSKEELPEIVISQTDVAHLRAQWQVLWRREPTPAELKVVVDEHIRSEILYREALTRGMDREDPRVGIVLIQKMLMLAAGQADSKGSTTKDVEAFYALRKETYRVPPRLSVQYVFFKEKDDGRKRAEKALAEIRKKPPSEALVQQMGDATMLQRAHSAIDATELEKLYGPDFTAAVLSVPNGEWGGPFRSGYGLHVVNVYDRIPGRIPDLAEVREKVEGDLMYETRAAAEEQGYQEIASKYRVVIDAKAGQVLEDMAK